MKRPRISTRTLMMVVLGCGLFLGLGLPAAEVYRRGEPHVHGFIKPSGRLWGGWLDVDEVVAQPFWSRYLRRLSGKPCGGILGQTEEVCELEHPGNFFDNICGANDLPYRLVYPTEAMYRKIESLRATQTVAK